ncbi:MAG: hypothetical protein QOH61_1726 [Chloroflexota bacterium]|jgi:hypothetical protein|nr:hypothetical protein [Chloroflexota bacterium]
MDHSPTGFRLRSLRLVARATGALLLCGAMLLPAAAVHAADITMTAQPMLGGNVRPGAWAGFRVHLENSGPAIRGELRISGGAQGSSTYGTPIELATGARQDQLLYAQPMWFGAKLTLQLVAEGAVVATQDLKVTILDAYTPTIVVVAERPEGIVRDLRAATRNDQFGQAPAVLTIRPEDLPPRAEAWSAIDRLVWQDSDSSRLSTEQLAALATWVSAGGRFAIVGGTTGTTGLSAFPAELLPFVPTHTADAQPSDITPLFGTLPANATAAPVLAGTLQRGSILARVGDDVFAAQSSYGQGLVSIVGLDPATSWVAGTAAAESLWRRLLPSIPGGAVSNPLIFQDDSLLVGALNNLPAVELPKIELLFAVLLGYIAVVGPLNYLVLRRLDRREWAWVTMPVLVVVFAVAAYGLGLGLKGTDVIINQVGLIRGATGTDRGIGAFYVGVFAPSRHVFDVRVSNSALIANPVYLQQQGQAGVPLDVVEGDPSHLRGYEVGFGVLRSFRAEASVAAPRVESDLVYEGGRLKGSITNRSDRTLENVAVVYGGNVALVPNLEPGASSQIDMDVTTRAFANSGTPLSQRIFGAANFLATTPSSRTEATRRAVIDQITGYSDTLGGYGAVQAGPVILGWQPTSQLSIEVDTEAQRVGETLAILAAPVRLAGAAIFTPALFQHSQLDSTANDASDQGGSNFSLSRGTMSVEFRPIGVSGSFVTDHLRLVLSQGEIQSIGSAGEVLSPLPEADQPNQEDPLLAADGSTLTSTGGTDPTTGVDTSAGGGTDPDPSGGAVPPPPDDQLPGGGKPGVFDGLPELQLFDRTAGRWVEFPHLVSGKTYEVADAAHYVDATGGFLIRFVNRAQEGESAYFNVIQRLEGSVQ